MPDIPTPLDAERRARIAEFEAAARRPLALRRRDAFRKTYKPVLDDMAKWRKELETARQRRKETKTPSSDDGADQPRRGEVQWLEGESLSALLGREFMGRVREYIKVKGKKFWTLFDTGARNTYVVPRVAAQLVTSELHEPFRSALGGGIKESKQSAILEATVEGHRVSTLAMVIDRIGKDEDGRPIDILFGALAMRNWNIRPIPDEERLDLSHYPEEFVEF